MLHFWTKAAHLALRILRKSVVIGRVKQVVFDFGPEETFWVKLVFHYKLDKVGELQQLNYHQTFIQIRVWRSETSQIM